MCYKFSAQEALTQISAHEVTSAGKNLAWRLWGQEAPVDFVIVNVPFYQGRAVLPWLLKDADLKRNRGLVAHLGAFGAAMRTAKKKIVLHKNRGVKALSASLKCFFDEVNRAGLPYRAHFAVCTALESAIDGKLGRFGGNFATVTGELPVYGDWKEAVRDNAQRFVDYVKRQGVDIQMIPAVDCWLQHHWPVTDDLGELGRTLLPSVLEEVRAEYGQETVWLDVQGLSDDKLVLKTVDKAIPGIHVVRLPVDDTRPTSEICYF